MLLLQIMTRVRTIERLVAQGKVGDDVALDGGLEHRPLEPRGVAQMATFDVAICADPEPHEDVPAEARAEFARSAPGFARPRGCGSRCGHRHRLPAAAAFRTVAHRTADIRAI